MIDFSGLEGLIQNRANSLTMASPVTQTPPVSQGQPANQPVDIRAELAKIITGPSQAPQQGFLQTLLGALAQGVGTATSGNPGAALLQQVQNIQQQKQIQQERQDKFQMLQQNFLLNDLNNKIAEERQIREERRREASDIAKEQRISTIEEKKSATAFQRQKDLEEIQNNYRMQELKFNKEGNIELENLRTSNNRLSQRMASLYETAAPLLFSGYATAADAERIFNKLDAGEKLDSSDQKILSQANKSLRDEKFRNERTLTALAHRGSGSSGGGFMGELTKLLINKSLSSNYYLDQNDQVQEYTKDMVGQLVPAPGTQVKRNLTPTESAQYGLQVAQSLTKGMPQNVNAKVTGPDAEVQFKTLLPKVQQDINSGIPRENIIKGLINSGVSSEVVNRIMGNVQEVPKQETTTFIDSKGNVQTGVKKNPIAETGKGIKKLAEFLKPVPGSLGSEGSATY